MEKVKIEDGETVLALGYKENYIKYPLFEECPIKTLYIGRNITYETDFPFKYVIDHYDNDNNNDFLSEVIIGNNVTDNIVEKAFRNCRNLKSVTIGNSVTKIEVDAFSGCKSLTSVTIGNSVTDIHSAFRSCSSLTSITIPNSVTNISGAFSGCSFINITIPNSVTNICNAFSGCKSLKNVTIPNSVTNMKGAFYNCSSLTSITIPNSVTDIRSAFWGCSSLTSITIPNSVTDLGDNIFDGCSSLTSLIIPNAIEKIGYRAFADCDALKELYVLNPVPPTLSSSAFSKKQYMTMNVYVPQEALAAYQSHEEWKNFWNLQGFDTSGITSVDMDSIENDTWYDLNGRKMDAPIHGVNIKNGKKILVR